MLEIGFIIMLIWCLVNAYTDNELLNKSKTVSHFRNGFISIFISIIIPLYYYIDLVTIDKVLNYWDNILGLSFCYLTVRMIYFPIIFNFFRDNPTFYIGNTAFIDRLLGNLYWIIATLFFGISLIFYLYLTI